MCGKKTYLGEKSQHTGSGVNLLKFGTSIANPMILSWFTAITPLDKNKQSVHQLVADVVAVWDFLLFSLMTLHERCMDESDVERDPPDIDYCLVKKFTSKLPKIGTRWAATSMNAHLGAIIILWSMVHIIFFDFLIFCLWDDRFLNCCGLCRYGVFTSNWCNDEINRNLYETKLCLLDVHCLCFVFIFQHQRSQSTGSWQGAEF